MSDEESKKLLAVRDRIDQLDEQIQNLINERASCAQQVAEIKQKAGEERVVFYRPEREAEVLRKVKERNLGPLDSEEMARLFREIMSACLAHEQPMKIAFLGPAGTFTQEAALKHFGHSVITMPIGAIDEVFREVESGDCDYGVVPVENSTGGVVNHTLDTFIHSPLKISGEVELRIHQNLLSNESALTDITHVYSHQQSLAQCREWLDANLPGVERIPVSSNAEAARLASSEKGAAAIAGIVAAELYEIATLAGKIEDEPDNTTRFLIIGRSSVPPSGDDKTSLLVSASNKPGALFQLLEPFAENGVSMTRIESRPSRRGTWDYVFFVDLEGHAEEAPVVDALKQLSGSSSMLKILGSYPRAVL